MLTSCFRLSEQLVNDVVVGEGPSDPRVLGQLLLDSDADPALGKKPLQLLTGLELEKRRIELPLI